MTVKIDTQLPNPRLTISDAPSTELISLIEPNCQLPIAVFFLTEFKPRRNRRRQWAELTWGPRLGQLCTAATSRSGREARHHGRRLRGGHRLPPAGRWEGGLRLRSAAAWVGGSRGGTARNETSAALTTARLWLWLSLPWICNCFHWADYLLGWRLWTVGSLCLVTSATNRCPKGIGSPWLP